MKKILAVVIVVLIIGGIYLGTKTKKEVVENVTPTPTEKVFSLTSTAFAEGASLPIEYTCEGAGVNPPLTINNAPAGTVSFALTDYDPDVPVQVKADGFFDHWAVFNIPGTTTEILASSTIGTVGNNGMGKPGYIGACPPKEFAPTEHRYIFTVYALDGNLTLPAGANRQQIEAALVAPNAPKTLGKAVLTGKYQKVK